LFHEHSADEVGDECAVGKDTDDVGAPRQLTIEALAGLDDQTWRQISPEQVKMADTKVATTAGWL
jgi:hypothetical protein